ncbi:ABC transporter substrate-binding protein [Paracoccus sp. (in: a-proteobacteria)]|uniref:ABC transporter substrate-binding protein n=1 Tax=Paracoccus sp. TaxID=267 RepID=UPI0026E06B97|nr:ABC transporter substrate-binding protein [Paracoccus sp. (in: a-proteobacteria)]MDO5647074.1 ABC transporter substrate-binding protein [Paracoccus sp. (in: a-proteobacteria)]
MTMTMHRLLNRSALVGVALSLTIGAAQAETLRWVRSMDVTTLDPHAQNGGANLPFLQNVYDTLVGRDIDGNMTPELATEWALHPEDDSVWVFTLRQGVKFHDGAELTADDVVFSLDRARSEASDFKALHANVVSVTAVDDYTVHVQMDGPAPLYPQNLTNTFIMDRGWAEANNALNVQDYVGGQDTFASRNTNGTGPFQVTAREPEVRTTLTRFDGYWGDQPQTTNLVFMPITEPATRIAALLSGEVDFVQDVPVQDIQRLQQTDSVTVTTGPENRTIYFGYDMGSDKLRSSDAAENPFKQPGVRQALSLVLDRDAIKQVVMRGQSDPTGAVIPPFVNGWTPEMNAYAAPDLDRAKELMAEAGYESGFSVDLNCPSGRYLNDEAICQAFAGMLGRIGIRANLVAQPTALHFPLVQQGAVDFYMMGWGIPTFDSQYAFDFLFHSRTESLGGWNASHYSNADVDAKIESLSSDVDVDHRNATIAAIWDVLNADHVVLPVHNQVQAYAARRGVNVQVHPENQPKIKDITFD